MYNLIYIFLLIYTLLHGKVLSNHMKANVRLWTVTKIIAITNYNELKKLYMCHFNTRTLKLKNRYKV